MSREGESEAARVAAVRSLGLLDTPPDEAFDRLVRLTATVLGLPIALVNLVDADRLWCRASVGDPGAEIDRNGPFCSIAIEEDSEVPFVVEDASQDPRFAAHPAVAGDPHIRFYVGHPLCGPRGYRVGTLCAMDTQPRQLTDDQRAGLSDLAATAEDLLARQVLSHALSTSEAMQRATLDALDQGVVLARPTGDLVVANPACERILGYTAAELSHRWKTGQWETWDRSGQVLPLEGRPIVRAVRSGQAILDSEVWWQHSDGRRILLRLSVIPVPGEDGAEDLTVLAFTEITEEHRTKRLLDATFSSAPVGLAVLDADRRILRANATYLDQMGLGTATPEGREPLELVHQDDRTLADQDWTTALTRDEPTPARDLRVQRSNGGEAWISTTNRRVSDGAGDLVISAGIDVTERHRLEQALRRFHLLFRHAGDIITVVDAAGWVQYTSPSTLRVLGYPEDHRLSAGVLGLIHPDDLDDVTEAFNAFVAGQRGPEPHVMRIRTFDGDWRHLESVPTNLLHEPDVGAIVITSRDVSERQRLTDRLAHQASHDHLTGLLSRGAAEAELGVALERAERDGTLMAVCFLDLDGFKEINDTHGHQAGDEVLVDVAARLQASVRTADTIARLGGDEFLAILDPVTDGIQADELATRIVHGVGGDRTVLAGQVWCGVSAGVALNRPHDTINDLLRRADDALYEAKHSGKGRAFVATA